MPLLQDSIQVETLTTLNSLVSNPTSTATTASGTLTLGATSTMAQYLTGTAAGFSVVLPSATTVAVGWRQEIYNTTNQVVTVKDGSGATLMTLAQNSVGYFILQIAGSTAGTWIYWQVLTTTTASGIINYNLVSNSAFASAAVADTFVTGMTLTPQAGTYAVWINFQLTGSGAGQQIDTTVYNGGVAIVDSKRSNLSTSGTHIFSSSTQTIAQFNGSNACALYINSNGNSFTVGARSMLMIRLGT